MYLKDLMKNLIKLLKQREIKSKNFKEKSHYELGEKLGYVRF